MFDVAKALLIPFASLQLLDLKPSFVYASIIMRMNLLLWKQFINLRQRAFDEPSIFRNWSYSCGGFPMYRQKLGVIITFIWPKSDTVNL